MEELKEEEIRGALKKMKNKKIVNIDRIPMEMWKYAEDTLWKDRTIGTNLSTIGINETRRDT